jgi:hypothetical protein
MSGFDLKQVNRNDKGLIGAGIVVFIASFLPYWGWSAGGFGDYSTSAWTGYAVFGLLLLFIAAGIAAARVFGGANLPKLPVGANLLVAALAAIGTLLVILRGFTYPHADLGSAGSVGVRWGGYILMIAAIVETVFAVMNFRSSGEKLAWDAAALNKPATAGGAPVPPAQPSSPTDQSTNSSSSDQV